MAEEQYKKRIRVNTSISVKGVITWDVTVEMVDTDQEVVLAESDALVRQLEIRYPLKMEEK